MRARWREAADDDCECEWLCKMSVCEGHSAVDAHEWLSGWCECARKHVGLHHCFSSQRAQADAGVLV